MLNILFATLKTCLESLAELPNAIRFDSAFALSERNIRASTAFRPEKNLVEFSCFLHEKNNDTTQRKVIIKRFILNANFIVCF